jgi:hypothetical protein
MRISIGRLGFFWWGTFLRGWLQWGRGFTVVADKDCKVQTVWTFLFGPLEIEWWNRRDWRRYCFTPAEAEEADRNDAYP